MTALQYVCLIVTYLKNTSALLPNVCLFGTDLKKVTDNNLLEYLCLKTLIGTYLKTMSALLQYVCLIVTYLKTVSAVLRY